MLLQLKTITDMRTSKKTIIVPHGVMVKLEQSTGATQQTLRNALRGVTNTPLAELIRKRALELGGVMAKD